VVHPRAVNVRHERHRHVPNVKHQCSLVGAGDGETFTVLDERDCVSYFV